MLMNALLVVLFLLLIYIYGRWVQLKQYWAKRNVAHFPPYPVVGNFTFMLRENPALWFRRLYDHFKEPYVGIWIFWQPGLIVNSPQIAKNIFNVDQSNFRNRFASSGSSDPVGSLNLFTLNDPLWSVLRRKLTFFFTSSKLKGIQTLLTEKSNALIERIKNDKKKHKFINLRSLMTDYSTDIIGTSSFGVQLDTTVTGQSVLRSITEEFMKFNIIRGMAWCCSFFIPGLSNFFWFKLFPTKSTEQLRKILRTIIAQRGGLENKVTEPRDLLDILIKVKQDNGEEINMTENMMLAQATIFVQGGFDTSSTVLSFIIYELAYCPEAQERLYRELQHAKDEHGDGFLDGSVLSHITYLNCVINEGLRKYPIIGWMDRIANEDYKVDENLTIKAGTPVYVNVVGMHYDPDLFPEPERFNPDRFLPENENDIKPFSYLPFGEGPRKCIGQRFGLSTVRHGLAAVVLHYELKPLPNFPKPVDVKLDHLGLLVAPGQDISVDFVTRNQNK